MEDRRSSYWSVPLAAILLVAVLLGVYVCGYFNLATITVSLQDGPVVVRMYHQLWLVRIYKPLGVVESRIKGSMVDIVVDEFPAEDDVPEVEGF
jgi:hypothetical protein